MSCLTIIYILGIYIFSIFINCNVILHNFELYNYNNVQITYRKGFTKGEQSKVVSFLTEK